MSIEVFQDPVGAKGNEEYENLKGVFDNVMGGLLGGLEEYLTLASTKIDLTTGAFSFGDPSATRLQEGIKKSLEDLQSLIPKLANFGVLSLPVKVWDSANIIIAIYNDGWEAGAEEFSKIVATTAATGLAVGAAAALIAGTALAAEGVLATLVVGSVAALANIGSAFIWDVAADFVKGLSEADDVVISKAQLGDDLSYVNGVVSCYVISPLDSLVFNGVSNEAYMRANDQAILEGMIKASLSKQEIKYIIEGDRHFAVVDSVNQDLIERNNVSVIAGESYVTSAVHL